MHLTVLLLLINCSAVFPSVATAYGNIPGRKVNSRDSARHKKQAPDLHAGDDHESTLYIPIPSLSPSQSPTQISTTLPIETAVQPLPDPPVTERLINSSNGIPATTIAVSLSAAIITCCGLFLAFARCRRNDNDAEIDGGSKLNARIAVISDEDDQVKPTPDFESPVIENNLSIFTELSTTMEDSSFETLNGETPPSNRIPTPLLGNSDDEVLDANDDFFCEV